MSEQEVMMPIHRAIKQGNLPEVIRLIAEDPNRLQMLTPFGTWLQDAAAQGKLDIVKWLVSQGLDTNAYDASNESPPLAKAAARGHFDVVKYLIEEGAVLDVSDSVRNPLFAAIVGGFSDSHTAVSKLLIDSGIDTRVRYTGESMKDMDAIAFAREWGRSDIVKLLEAHHKSQAAR